MKSVPIGDLVERTRQCDPRELGRDRFTYIDISSVDREAKRIVSAQFLATSQAPSRARKQVRAGDVILSTVRPSLNAVALVQPQFDGEIASTGFAVLRAKPSALDPRYLFYFLQTEGLVTQLTRIATGASYPAISDDDALQTAIPLPDLADQERIAAILERADRLRRLRRYGLEESDTILPAAFLDSFGDLEREPTRWNRIEFDEVCMVSDATVDPKDARYSDLPQISSEDIESVSGELGPLRTAKQKGVISINFLVDPGEIVFSKIRPRLRKVAYPKIKALCSADIYPIRIVSPGCHPQYLLFYLRSDCFSGVVGRLAEARCNIPKVNRDELSEQTIPLPPLSLQEKFAGLVERTERLRQVHRESLRQTEHLFQTLLHRTFTSGL